MPLHLDYPLVEDFPLDDGQVSFDVPNVPPGSNYIVVRELFRAFFCLRL